MKKIIFYIQFLILLCTINRVYGNENYLIDTLNYSALNIDDQHLLDSIIEVYHQSSDSVKIQCLADLSEQLNDGKLWPRYNEFMLKFANEKLNQLSGDLKEERKYFLFYKNLALNNKGYLHLMQGDYQKAIHYYNQSKLVLEETEDLQGLAVYHNTIGYIYINQGAISRGLESLLKSLKIKEELPDKGSYATTLTNIGYVYKNQGEYEQALSFFEQSLAIREAQKDNAGVAVCLGHIGSIYESQKQLEKASDFYTKAYEVSKETQDEYNIAFHLFNIGSIFHQQEKYEEAIEVLIQGLTLKEKLKDKVGIANGLINLGEVYLSMGKLDEAKRNGLKGLAIVQVLDNKLEIEKAATLLYKTFKAKDKPSKALQYYELANEMKSVINSEETQKAAVKHQMEYEFEKQHVTDSLNFEQQQAIKELKHESELKDEAQQRYILYGGLLVMLLIGVLIFRGYNQKKRDNEVIVFQKKEVEKAHAVLEEKNAEILDSINYAKRIQTAILPAANLFTDSFTDSFIFYKPKDIVAGDFYWIETLSVLDTETNEIKGDGSTKEFSQQVREGDFALFAVADCTGHGVPGAMVSVVCHNGLNRSVREFGLTDPAMILDKTRELVVQEFAKSEEEVKDGMDIALCSLQLKSHLEGGEGGMILKYAGANNPLWVITPCQSELVEDSGKEEVSILRRAQDDTPTLIEIKANKQPIGSFEKSESFTTHTIEVQKGDCIYLFSDGFVDQFGGPKEKKFKSKNLKKLLLENTTLPMLEQNRILEQTLLSWMRESNAEQIDDVCIMGIRV